MDVSSLGYNEKNLYKNHRYKKTNQPTLRESCTLHGVEAPGDIRVGPRYVKDHSVAPYAYIGTNKMFEEADTLDDEMRRRKAMQIQNRKNYQYRKFLRDRHNQLQENIMNSAERYKVPSIGLNLPEIG